MCNQYLHFCFLHPVTSSYYKGFHKSVSEKNANKSTFVGTPPYEHLKELQTKGSLLKDIRQMSGKHATSSLEAFHSILNHFATKQLAFSYHGMTSMCVSIKEFEIKISQFTSINNYGNKNNSKALLLTRNS